MGPLVLFIVIVNLLVYAIPAADEVLITEEDIAADAPSLDDTADDNEVPTIGVRNAIPDEELIDDLDICRSEPSYFDELDTIVDEQFTNSPRAKVSYLKAKRSGLIKFYR